MLANVVRTLVNSLFKKNVFFLKSNKCFDNFFIFYKSCAKIFLKLIVNHYSKDIC